jgi:hypothetical protein
MPVVKRGFLFAYFEKIICGVVALGVLAAIVYTMLQAGSLKGVSRESVQTDLKVIEQATERKATSVAPKDYESIIAQGLERVPEPQPIRDPMHLPLAQRYAPVSVAPNTEFTLEFKEPVLPRSLAVTGKQGLLQIGTHPVGDDYRRVVMKSLGKEGEAEVVGDVGPAKHIIPVIVSKDAGKTAYPPSKVTVMSAQNTVTLQIEPNKENDKGGVEVLAYQIWRRDWSDPLGDYAKVGEPTSAETGAAMPGVTPTAPFAVPGAARARGTGAPAVAVVMWQDGSVSPGRRYSYKVRTWGGNTYPPASNFTDPIMVQVSADVDFQFSRSTGLKVGFDVIKKFPNGVTGKEPFWVGKGDEIGGAVVDRVTSEKIVYETGDFLVDFHRGVILSGGVTDRLVYADQEGNLHARVRNETKSDLWKLVGGATPTRAGVPGAPPGVR